MKFKKVIDFVNIIKQSVDERAIVSITVDGEETLITISLRKADKRYKMGTPDFRVLKVSSEELEQDAKAIAKDIKLLIKSELQNGIG